jgi:hypothetical protein
MPHTPSQSPAHSRHPSVSMSAASSSGSASAAVALDPYAELARLSQQVAAMQAHMQQQAELADQAVQRSAASAASSSAAAAAVVAAAASASAPRHLPKIAPPHRFKGEMGVHADHWIGALEQQFEYYDREFATDAAKIRFGVAYLDQGTALRWYQTLPEPKPATWDAFVRALRARFRPVEASMVARVSLGRLRQGERNSVSAYTNAFQNLMAQIVEMSVTDQVFHFVAGLLPSLRVRVWEKLPQTLAEAIGYAASYEATIGFAGRAGGFASSSTSGHSGFGASSSTSSSSGSVPMDVNYIDVDEEAQAGEDVRLETPGPARPSSEAALLAKLEAMEHRIAALMGSGSGSGSKPPSQKSGDRVPGLQANEIGRLLKEGRCFRCKKTGHMKSDCPNKPRGSSN